MSGNIVREWNFWLASILAGACMAFLYDCVRLIRRLVRHGRLAVDLEDAVYWSACFGISFVLLYYGNNGVIRFAAVLGAAAGMAVYTATAGRVFVRFCCFAIDRTAGRAIRLLRRSFVPARKAAIKLHQKKIIFYKKCRLTAEVFRHRIVVYIHKRRTRGNTGKGETGHGKKAKKQKSKKEKDAKIPPCPK